MQANEKENISGLVPVGNSGGKMAKRSTKSAIAKRKEQSDGDSSNHAANQLAIQTAIEAAGLELQEHQQFLSLLGGEVAHRKVEMVRSLPDQIEGAVMTELSANPIDVDAGARAVREMFQSSEMRSLLDSMGVEVSFE